MRNASIIPHRGTIPPAGGLRRFAAMALVFALYCLISAAVNAEGPGFEAVEAGKAGEAVEAREVIAAVPRHYPPLVDVDGAGKPAGLAIDMMQAIARRAGLRVRYLVQNDWPSAARAVAEGRADLLPGVGRTAAGEKTMAFTRPFDILPVSLFVRSGARDIDGVLDLTGRRVAVVGGDVGAAVLRPYRSITAETYASFQDALVALLAGNVDALVFPAPAVRLTARAIGVADRIRMVGAPLAKIKRSIGVRREDVALLRRLDAATAAFLGTPQARAIRQKWREPQRPVFSRTEVWWILSGVLALLLIGVAVWRIVSVIRLNRELAAAAAARERAETAQRESDQRLDIAFGTGSIGMTVTDADGRLLRVNKAFCDFLGYSEAELLDGPFIDSIHPDDVRKSKARLARLFAGEDDHMQMERRYVRKDGAAVWGYCGIGAARGEDGNITYIIANVQDITELKRAEQALLESEERSRLLLDSTGEAIYGIDNQGLCTFANPMCAELLGYAGPEELVGRHMHDLIHHTRPDGDAYPVSECRIYQAFVEGKGSHVIDEVLWRSDGSAFPAEYRSFPMRRGSDIVGAVVSFVDISAQKNAEEALRYSEKRFRSVFEDSGVGLIAADEDGVFVEANKAAGDLLGFREHELIGKTTFEISHPDEIETTRRRMDLIRSGEADHLTAEKRFIRKDGATVWVITTVTTIRDDDGGLRNVVINLQDITELKRAEESRKDGERRIRGIMENIADGVVTMGVDGVIETANPAVTGMFGYAAEELIGKPVTMLMPEPYRSAHDGYVGAYLETGKGKILGIGAREVPGVRKDGSEFPLSLAVSEMRLGERRIFIGGLRDVSERKRAEAELSRKTEYLGLVREAAVAANEASNFEDVLASSVRQICQFLDWPVGHAYILSAQDTDTLIPSAVWHIADPDRFARFLSVTNATEFTRSIELPGRVLDKGMPAWISDVRGDANFPRAKSAAQVGLKSAFAFPVVTGDRIVAVLEFFTDRIVEPDEALLDVMAQIGTQLGRVAEREQADEARRANEKRLRQIIDLVPHRIFIKDRNGNYHLVNKAAAKAHNTTPKELVGRPHTPGYRHREQLKKLNVDDVEVIETGRPKLIPEETFQDSDGNVRYLRTMKVPYRAAPGGETLVLGVAVDITDQKAAEEQLRHAQMLEAIGQLTGGLAHDFNNLLTIVLGNLQLLVRRLDDDRMKEMAMTAERAGRRGAELTQRLLAFGRRQSLQPRAVELNRLVLGMTDLLRRTLGETIEIETVLGDAIRPTMVDPAQVENAILNLAINARDAMPQGGVLTIRTGTRKIDEQIAVGGDDVSPGEFVILAISDTGTGMPPDVAERAFDPFFTTKETGRGSGLGLSMIYGFCRQSGGFATIDSEPGQGTTVSLFLPATDAAEEIDATASTDAMYETGHETVLVVEDDPGVRMFAATVLGSLNYSVLEAADGRAALETLESNGKIDVLFTDVVLPGGVDGRDIANQARTRQPDINVLFTSGFAVDEVDDENRELMEPAMLRKPYTGAELAAKIRGVIEHLDGENQ